MTQKQLVSHIKRFAQLGKHVIIVAMRNRNLIGGDTIINALTEALRTLDWSFVTPSQVDYGDSESHQSTVLHWQERMFAYETYHRLREIWNRKPHLHASSLIHAEVRKKYQRIPDFDYMPDFLFHLPQPGCNYAVVELKLASRDLIRDLEKLVSFKTILGYDRLIEVLIGSNKELEKAVAAVTIGGDITIDVICLSIDTKDVTHRQIKFPRTDSQEIPN